MSVPLVYALVVLIWSTTPLAIKWSNTGFTPLTAITLRIGLSWLIALVVCLSFRRFNIGFVRNWRLYASGSLGIFPGLVLVYLSAEYIPSGMISVLFGMSPFLTALLSSWVLKAKPMLPYQWGALGIALSGLLLIFADQLNTDLKGVIGIFLLIGAVVVFSTSAVLVKRWATEADPLSQLTGSLTWATPLLFFSWLIVDGNIPNQWHYQSFYSVVYLAVLGSFVGFIAYYYLLQRVSVVVVSMVPMITPMLALILGLTLNNEPLTVRLMIGSGLILTGLGIFIFGKHLFDWYFRRRKLIG